jgi:hypothetical protein
MEIVSWFLEKSEGTWAVGGRSNRLSWNTTYTMSAMMAPKCLTLAYPLYDTMFVVVVVVVFSVKMVVIMVVETVVFGISLVDGCRISKPLFHSILQLALFPNKT